ncbi:hypothetical protein ES708_23963 [subsurface metagenome]
MQILTAILKEEHRRQGLYLEENDHTLYLKRGQQVLARFSATGATMEEIHREADKYIEVYYGRN